MEDNDSQPEMAAGKRRALTILGVVAVIGSVIGYFSWRYSETHISTDDAFVEGAIHIIAARVPGAVKTVAADHNREVRAGDLLVELDAEPYRRKLAEAEAAVEAERARLAELAAAVDTQAARATVAEASLERTSAVKDELSAATAVREADLKAKKALESQAEANLVRADDLLKNEYVTRERYDDAKTRLETSASQTEAAEQLKRQAEASATTGDAAITQARAAHDAERAALAQARAAVESQKAQIKKREAELETAKLNLSYTKVLAPADGFVTRRSVEAGNQVQAGQPLMSIVPLRKVNVLANFKETQLGKIKPGQRVSIKIDSHPGVELTGRVESIMAGSGAVFSLFPPENASGNYVKVVQRIPVRIVFDDNSRADSLLRVGMSVVPTVIAE